MKKICLALVVTSLAVVTACSPTPDPSRDSSVEQKDVQGSGTSVLEPFAYPCQEQLEASGDDFLSEADWEIGPLSFPVPYSASAGGCQVLDSGARAGFAHTEAGATAAALTAVAGYSPGYNQQQFDELEAKIAHGVGFESSVSGAERALRQGYEAITVNEANVFAYRMEAYSDEEALFTVFVRVRQGNEIVAFRVPLTWEGGDWKVLPTGDEKSYYLELAQHQGALGEVVTLPVTTAEQVEN